VADGVNGCVEVYLRYFRTTKGGKFGLRFDPVQRYFCESHYRRIIGVGVGAVLRRISTTSISGAFPADELVCIKQRSRLCPRYIPECGLKTRIAGGYKASDVELVCIRYRRKLIRLTVDGDERLDKVEICSRALAFCDV